MGTFKLNYERKQGVKSILQGGYMNPYTRLLNNIKKWVDNLECRHEVFMWRYPKEKLDLLWKLEDLYHRVSAAEQLGYEVVLEASEEDGLTVKYRKKMPPIPFEWKY